MHRRTHEHSYHFASASDRPLTLIELLRRRACRQPKDVAYTFLVDGETEEVKLTYGEVDACARVVSDWLKPLVSHGERVLLLYPPGLEFIVAFFGCLYAGAVAVPAYPPRRNRNLLRLQAIVADAEAAVALTTSQILARVEPHFAHNPYLKPLRWLATDSVPPIATADSFEPPVRGDSLAFLQYTSGSTGTPKGVMLSHDNLLHNAALVHHACEHTSADRYVSWLPTFHDMGFMAGVLQPLYGGLPVVLMSPTSFLQRPVRWLEAISRYRGTVSGGPNFAYELCVRKIKPEQSASLDLSSWAVAFNGAEPIRSETLERFAKMFAPFGFRREALYPCYGLAEATLMVSGSYKSEPPTLKTVTAKALEKNLVVTVPEDDEHARSLVGCGGSLLGQQIVIAEPESLKSCAPGQVGEIWVAGPSVARGYWNKPEETAQTFAAYLSDTGEGPFLRTGDLGFMDDTELFVTGRLKDLIIIRGLNHYPQDIELTAEESHPALRSGCGAAFSIEVAGEESLVFVGEADQPPQLGWEAVIQAICEATVRNHEVPLHAVSLIKAGSIPKTSSGKIQRRACRTSFLQRSLEVIAEWRAGSSQEDETTAAELEATLENQDEIACWLMKQLAAKLRIDSSELDVRQSIARYGLDSLMAIELKHELEAKLGVSVPLASFLEAPSIMQLAAEISTALTNDLQEEKPAPTPASEKVSEAPLSRGQQAMLFLHQIAPESTAYNIASAVKIEAALDVAAFGRAFQALVDRHPALRTVFTIRQSGPVQQIQQTEVYFKIEDAENWDEETLRRRLVDDAYRPFNLETGPVFRVTLFRRSATEHILLLAVHHIAADFWSLSVLVNELGIIYEAETIGKPASLPHLALRFTDYVRWQEDLLQGEDGERLWSYWQKQLAGELPTLDLPLSRPRPALQTYQGGSQHFVLSAKLTRALKDLSRNHGTTLYTTLLAAFQVLLHRYTHQQVLTVGSPTSGRNWAQLAGVVGYFTNPIVLLADFSQNRTFQAFLASTRQIVLDAFAHQDFPFSTLVERLQPERDLSRSPLFQAMFVLQKAHLLNAEGLSSFALGEAGATIKLGELCLESIALEDRVSQFDLTLMMTETDEELEGSLQYNTDLFDDETIARLAGHYERLLESIVRAPEQRVSELELLGVEERARLLREWNETGAAYGGPPTVAQLFEEQVERTPAAVAVVYEAEALSYRELNERANQLAHHLRGLGVGPESLVGVCMERSAELVVSLLGVLKAGGAYLPLDPAYPSERLGYMLADAAVAVLLTQEAFAERFRGQQANAVYVDRDWAKISRESRTNPKGGAGCDNLAYVVYTSGSTGQPKGIELAHRGLLNLIGWHQHCFNVSASDRATQLAGVAFDAAVWELWPYLTAGASIHLPSEETRTSPAALRDWLVAKRITITFMSTPLAESVLTLEWPRETTLRLLLTGGDKLHSYPPASLPFTLINNYGPSEATVVATSTEVVAGGPTQGSPPIGKAIGNTRIYLLDDAGEIVPIGVVGELYIGGASVARGYLKRPALSAEAFVPDPFAGSGGRLYRTGDLARYRVDGSLEFIGRRDQQIKIRGFRIELGEVEATLRGHERVREAVVMVVETEAAEKQLVGYVVSAAGMKVTSDELRRELRERLPDHMVPPVLVVLDELPLTANGKVDRKALSQRQVFNYDRTSVYVGPRNQLEEVLTNIWCEVLGLERVGIHDNFFELGGHSLLATQVMSRVRGTFKVEVSLRRLFELPTVAQLSESIEAALRGVAKLTAPPIVPVSRQQPLPLSFSQERLWLFDQLANMPAVYNVGGGVRLQGAVNAGALERALNEIVRRHEVLRTSYPTVDGQPVQLIAEAVAVGLPLIDLSEWDEAERAQETERRKREWQRAFDLGQGPCLRAGLLRLGAKEHLLLLTLHHIVADGWSLGILVRELSRLYEAYAGGGESPLAELPLQYGDYAQWQREWLQGEVLAEQLGYWRQQLEGAAAVLELPTDRARPAVQSFRGASYGFRLGAALTAGLKELSRGEGATLFMTLLAGFQTLLYRYTGQQDISVGTPIAGRGQLETEGLIGFFVNTLVLRSRLAEAQPFRELLGQVREVTLGAYAHQEVPFERLVEELAPGRELSHAPLFQVMFSLQNTPAAELRLAGLEISVEALASETARFDLTLDVVERAGELACAVEYNTDLFDGETIARLAGHYERLLESIVRAPEQRVSELELLGVEERARLLREWNETVAADGGPPTVAQLFEEQVERTPAAVAVVYEAEALSYRELNERANQLAHHLRGLGVGPESLVGVCMERSAELVVSLLGVLKAGGAYLPLDPAYPSERLGYMLADAAVAVLLTQERVVEAVTPLGELVLVDREWSRIAAAPSTNPQVRTSAENLAYVIYTSGSTGQPKGVMVNNGNVVNFFNGMDRTLGSETAGKWLSVTSIAFDISVLELLWTLTRGFEVVIQPQTEDVLPALGIPDEVANRPLDFSLFFFANYEGGSDENKYRLLLESARFADQHGFQAVWTPERHFHEFGGPYPNPAVVSAALATITERIEIRAGSVVLPLHNPIRVAEEWAIVDNLSRGRAAISFASGWHANDFVFAPEHYKDRQEIMYSRIDTVRRLWRGEAITVENGSGDEVEVRTLPRPIRRELPVWVTAAGNPETFRRAGQIGARLLTHLLGQNLEELTDKIKIYREAWSEYGHGPGEGHVTLMLHTFVGRNLDTVREKVRQPFINYLMSSVSLVKTMMKGLGVDPEAENFTDTDIEALLAQSFDRYFETSGLLGTPQTCLRMVYQLKSAGVDELACLIDFGVDSESVLTGLHQLKELKQRSNERSQGISRDYSLPAQIKTRQITHLQATPSLAKMLLSDSAAVEALGTLDKLMLGGEELPVWLAKQTSELVPGQVFNMYGPTETTVWSAVHPVTDVGDVVPIGRPIVNTSIYILDQHFEPTPIGVPGELFISGAGVVRGYLERPSLSAERFLSDPFSKTPGVRMYRTGDRARFLSNGTVEFLGRVDYQVKIRGYRVELGEIEAALEEAPGVREALVVAHDVEQSDKRLTAYLVLAPADVERPAKKIEQLTSELRDFLKQRLPEYMIPSAFITLDSFPLTPNGKLDRAALPAPEGLRPELEVPYVAPQTDAEQIVASVWQVVLQIEKTGINDNFFDLGGNSLLLVKVHTKLREAFKKDFPLIEMFRYPTINSLSRVFSQESSGTVTIQEAHSRAGRQAGAINARRQTMLERQQRKVGVRVN